MKKYIFLAGTLLLVNCLIAQSKPYNVVFDLTSKDTVDHQMVVKWLNGISKDDPTAKLEVVFYAQSLDMVTKGKSVVAEEVEQLAKNKNIAFRVCEVAMAKQKIEKGQLLNGVETVPDGIYEIVLKQREGYGYIKAAR
ncbi:MAG: DsrE family protein [Bacteroidota bacterium]